MQLPFKVRDRQGRIFLQNSDELGGQRGNNPVIAGVPCQTQPWRLNKIQSGPNLSDLPLAKPRSKSAQDSRADSPGLPCLPTWKAYSVSIYSSCRGGPSTSLWLCRTCRRCKQSPRGYSKCGICVLHGHTAGAVETVILIEDHISRLEPYSRGYCLPHPKDILNSATRQTDAAIMSAIWVVIGKASTSHMPIPGGAPVKWSITVPV